MIESVEINYLRGIRDGKVEGLSPLTILVGPNGCGKSTVLDAVFIGASPNLAEAAGWSVKRRGMARGARWLLWRADRTAEAHILVRTSNSHSHDCTIRLDGVHALQCSVTTEVSPSPAARPYVRFQTQGDYDADHVNVPLPDVSEVRLVDAARTRHIALHKFFTKAVEQGRRDEAREIMAAVVPGLHDIVILTDEDSPILHLDFRDHSVPVEVAGDGIGMLLRLTLELASRQRGVVLMEEPEAHQHPRAIGQTAKAVLAAVRRGIQVIVSTHSLDLIDNLLAHSNDADLQHISVQRLALTGGLLHCQRLTGKEVAFARSEIEDDLR